MSTQQRLKNTIDLREQILDQQRQQRESIIAQWRPIVIELLQILGETVWGNGKYTIVEPRQSGVWVIVNFKGTKNSQFYVILDFSLVDIDEILISSNPLPANLVTPIGFHVIGVQEYNTGLSRIELEKALAVASQQGANQEALPSEVKEALKHLPYQDEEHDDRAWWKKIIMWMAGPVTVVMSGIGLIQIPIFFVNELLSCSNTTPYEGVCGSISSTILFIGLNIAAWTICGIFLFGGIWATNLTKFGRRYNKLPSNQKGLATLALLPGIIITAYMELVFVVGIFAFFVWIASEGRKSEIRSAVHEELKEHGL